MYVEINSVILKEWHNTSLKNVPKISRPASWFGYKMPMI